MERLIMPEGTVVFGHDETINGLTGRIAMNHLREAEVSVSGRIDFGRGAIDASGTNEQSAIELGREASQKLVGVDYRGVPGTCMDARSDVETRAGNEVEVRPHVIGGPAMFAWNTAELAGFSLVKEAKNRGLNPLERFAVVVDVLDKAKFGVGGHQECGAIRGEEPVMETFASEVQKLISLADPEVLAQYKKAENPIGSENLKENAEALAKEIADMGDAWNEESVLAVIAKANGDDAVVVLDSDPNHPTHGHNEQIIARIRRRGQTVDKNALGGARAFLQDVEYGNDLIDALAISESERANGRLVGECYPLAGVATLGKNQYVVDIQ